MKKRRLRREVNREPSSEVFEEDDDENDEDEEESVKGRRRLRSRSRTKHEDNQDGAQGQGSRQGRAKSSGKRGSSAKRASAKAAHSSSAKKRTKKNHGNKSQGAAAIPVPNSAPVDPREDEEEEAADGQKEKPVDLRDGQELEPFDYDLLFRLCNVEPNNVVPEDGDVVVDGDFREFEELFSDIDSSSIMFQTPQILRAIGISKDLAANVLLWTLGNQDYPQSRDIFAAEVDFFIRSKEWQEALPDRAACQEGRRLAVLACNSLEDFALFQNWCHDDGEKLDGEKPGPQRQQYRDRGSGESDSSAGEELCSGSL